MRVVLDTNVLIAALIAHGTCHEVLEHCIHQHQLITSPFILEELHLNLLKKFGYSQREGSEAVHLLRSRMTVVTPTALGVSVSRDPDDDIILATAIAGSCQCLVTGDRDLLDLKRYQGIDIISPDTFWRYE